MIVGIDLGTTNSLIAVFRDGKPETVPNALGGVLTPSAVSVEDDGHVLVGQAARDRLISHPSSAAAEFKRAMGTDRTFTLARRTFRAEELSALVLKSLKADAEAFLGEPVTEAVISVPAYFNDNQRRATETAGTLAGLSVRRLINEPTAAALAYGLHRKDDETQFIVLDLGGGTFDVSILELFEGIMEVRAAAGDAFLGGTDFAGMLAAEIARRHGKTFPLLSPTDKAHMLKAAQGLIHTLSRAESATATVPLSQEHVEVTVDRAEFAALVQPLIDRIRRPTERALRDSKMRPDDLEEVLLVGGATRMPVVRHSVGRLFGRVPSTHLDPDRVVALGAAVQAALLAEDAAVSDRVLTDVCPFTLGLEICHKLPNGREIDGRFSPIIERNTVIPASRVQEYVPGTDFQKKVEINIYQGESRDVSNNVFLGSMNVDLPRAKAWENLLEVRFTYDTSGLLEVEATPRLSGRTSRVVIEGNQNRLSSAEIERRLASLSALKTHPRDQQANQAILARADRLHEEALSDTRAVIADLIDDFQSLLETQDMAQIDRARKELEERLDRFEENWKIL